MNQKGRKRRTSEISFTRGGENMEQPSLLLQLSSSRHQLNMAAGRTGGRRGWEGFRRRRWGKRRKDEEQSREAFSGCNPRIEVFREEKQTEPMIKPVRSIAASLGGTIRAIQTVWRQRRRQNKDSSVSQQLLLTWSEIFRHAVYFLSHQINDTLKHNNQNPLCSSSLESEFNEINR